MSDLLCLIAFQEEEIPELEIDIDELLELTDEGQRSRLQVRWRVTVKIIVLHEPVLFFLFFFMVNLRLHGCFTASDPCVLSQLLCVCVL